MADDLGWLALLGLFAFVWFGSTIPVVPTGPAVSGAAVIASGEQPWEILLVVLVGAAGAYTGDLLTYAVLRRAGVPLAQRVGWLHHDDPDGALARFRASIEAHEIRTLLLSRLVPGGRVPVLLAAALGGYPLVRYASAAVLAATLWAVVYTAIGVVGDSLFPDPQLSIVAAVVLAVLVSLAVQAVGARRRR